MCNEWSVKILPNLLNHKIHQYKVINLATNCSMKQQKCIVYSQDDLLVIDNLKIFSSTTTGSTLCDPMENITCDL